MKIYVAANAFRDGNGTQERPFKHINDAAKIAAARRRVFWWLPAFIGSMWTPRTPAPRKDPDCLPERRASGSGDHRRGGDPHLGAL